MALLKCANQTIASMADACRRLGVEPLQLGTSYPGKRLRLDEWTGVLESQCPIDFPPELLPEDLGWEGFPHFVQVRWATNSDTRFLLSLAALVPPLLILLNAMALETFRRMRKAKAAVYPLQVGQAAGDLVTCLVGTVFLVHEGLTLGRSAHNCYSWWWQGFSHAPMCLISGLSLGSAALQTAACRDRLNGILQPVAYRARAASKGSRSAVRTCVGCYSVGAVLGLVLVMPERGPWTAGSVRLAHDRTSFAEEWLCNSVLYAARRFFRVDHQGRFMTIHASSMHLREWMDSGSCLPKLEHPRSLAFVALLVGTDVSLLFYSLRLLWVFACIPEVKATKKGKEKGKVGGGHMTLVVLSEAGLQLAQLVAAIASQVAWHYLSWEAGFLGDLVTIFLVLLQLGASALFPLLLSKAYRRLLGTEAYDSRLRKRSSSWDQ